jgi:7-cyano-7-deazaguanine synthase
MSTGVAIVSGGMDSVTLAHYLKETTDDLVLVSFDYGQRHSVELRYAEECADRLDAAWLLVELDTVGALLSGSALTDTSVDVPLGHYESESMKATVVPNRNMIMLSIATGIAVARKANFVATAVHAGDHAIYPDCRPTFIDLMNQTAQIATEGFHAPAFQIVAPFVHMTKAEICSIGDSLDVPWDRTWSCYQGKDRHCGECGTCVERKEAFALADVKDPTTYVA